MKINGQEKTLFDAGMKRNGAHFTKRRTVDEDDGCTERTYSSSLGSFHPPMADMDMEEALFRATMDDPWAPMTPEEQALFEASKMDPWTGYTTEKDGAAEPRKETMAFI